MTLWVFGHSVCLPHGLGPGELGWADILAQELGLQLQNFAQQVADNFYIYASYQENKQYITDQDLVIVGWSHPSRKSFVLDRLNLNHMAVLDESLVYKLNTAELIRSYKSKPPAFGHWTKLRPSQTGKRFYDTWFADYYSEYEQQLNLQSYCDSVKSTSAGKYVPFFFSQESVAGLELVGAGYILEFIKDNNVAISDSNMHLNPRGHRLWSKHLKDYII